MILMESMNNFIIKFYEELLCDKDLQFSEKGYVFIKNVKLFFSLN